MSENTGQGQEIHPAGKDDTAKVRHFGELLFALILTPLFHAAGYRLAASLPYPPDSFPSAVLATGMVVLTILLFLIPAQRKYPAPLLIVLFLVGALSFRLFRGKIEDPLLASMFQHVTIVLIAFSLGNLMAWAFPLKRYIVPVLIVLLIMDTWSVYFGLTRQIVERHPRMIPQITMPLPVFGGTEGRAGLALLLGFTDFFYVMAAIGITRKFGLALFWTLVLMGLGLGIGLLLALGRRGVPILPFLAVAFAVANLKRLEWKPRDILTSIVFCVLFIPMLYLFMALPDWLGRR